MISSTFPSYKKRMLDGVNFFPNCLRKNIFSFLFFYLLSTAFNHIQANGSSQPHDSLPRFLYSEYTVTNIVLEGNDITKSKIILKELTFHKGDTLLSLDILNRFQQSKQNLLNTNLFNYVTIESLESGNDIEILVKVEERWYTWPGLIFDQADRNLTVWLVEKNWDKIKYGFEIQQNNVRGNNETIKLKLTMGYKQEMHLRYSNIFLDKESKHSLSFSGGYQRQHGLSYGIENNKSLDFKTDEKFVFDNMYLDISYLYRRSLYQRHGISLLREENNIIDSIALLNPDYFGQGRTNLNSFSLSYLFIHDFRNSANYPLEGYFIFFYAQKKGLGLTGDNALNTLDCNFKYNYYYKIRPRLYTATSINVQKFFGKSEPFRSQEILSGSNSLMGYERLLITGQDYALYKQSIKFEVIPQRIVKFNFIPIPKFNKIHYALYSLAFVNAAYVNDRFNKVQNMFANTPLYSYGVGLELVSYYDRILGIHYVVNKQGQGGFVLEMRAAIN